MKGIGFGFLRTGVSHAKEQCACLLLPLLRGLLNTETGAPGYFGLFGWHVPSSGLL